MDEDGEEDQDDKDGQDTSLNYAEEEKVVKDGDEVEEEDVNPLKTLQWMFCVIEWFVNGAGSGTSCVRMRGMRIREAIPREKCSFSPSMPQKSLFMQISCC